MHTHRMVNMILVATNKTGGPISHVRLSVSGDMLLDLPSLSAGECSPPVQFNGLPGPQVWRIWLVGKDGRRRRGSASCTVKLVDGNKCRLVALHPRSFIIHKARRFRVE